MPIPLSHEQYIRQCESAAYSSRLSPHALHAAEHQLLKLHLTSTQIGVYLNIRNAILRLWTRNPLVSVTSDEAAQCTREPRHVGLAIFAHEWLARNGYINFGCVEILAGTPRKPAHAAPRQTIVVIGAGMSGLSCARHLTALFKQFQEQWTKQRKQQVPQVIVIEGRGRIGGRLYSHPLKHQDSSAFPAKLANTAEIGAQIITGFDRGNPLDCILRGQLALHYHTMKDNMVLYDFDGSPIDSKRDRQIQDLFNDILESAAVHGWKSGQTFPAEDQKSLIKTLTKLPNYDAPVLASFLSEVTEEKILPPPSVQPTLGELMDQHVRDYRDTIGLSPQDLRMVNWHYANLEYANSVNVHQLSLGGWDQDSGNEFEGRHAEVIGGYSQIPRSLYKQPEPLDVRLHKIVRKVVYTSASDLNKHSASVVCEDGEVLDANYIVSTLPLGVMKQSPTLFDPPLPNWKLGAMSRLGFGLLNKIILVFDHIFWDQHRDMFGLLNQSDFVDSLSQTDYTARRGRFYLFWNCIKTSGRPVLIGLMAGDSAKETENTPAETLVREVTERLAVVFKLQQRPLPVEAIITRWGQDPFARGVYSYLGPQAEPGDYDSMARPVGNLHFAGEATCGTHPATVHGAYLSGLRAASDVVEAMIGSVPLPLIYGD